MKATRNGTDGSAERGELAGVSARQIGGAGRTGDHGRASGDTEGVRRFFNGTRSGERTAPRVTSSMRAAVRIDAPQARNLNLRTSSADTPPMATAMTVSDTPSLRIQSASSISGLAPAAVHVPAELPPARLADALAVMLSDLLDVLPGEGLAVRERLANRLFERGITVGGNEAAGLLGAVAAVLMRLE